MRGVGIILQYIHYTPGIIDDLGRKGTRKTLNKYLKNIKPVLDLQYCDPSTTVDIDKVSTFLI